MPFRIAQLPPTDKLPVDFGLPVLEHIYPRERVSEVLTRLDAWEKRERKLSQLVLIYLLIAWPLFLNHSLRAVFVRLSAPLRLLAGLCALVVPTHAALTYRRKQLGVRVLRTLWQHTAHPLATPQTPGAFAFGLRLVGIDGTLEDVADTAENAAFFGRISQSQPHSPYPQVRSVLLVEVGTHLILNAILAPCQADERRLSWGVLGSLSADMLLLLDRGFVCAAFFQAVRARQAHILARLSAGMFTHRHQVLADGSYLTILQPSSCRGLKEPMRVRVIEYWVKEPVAEQLVNVAPSRLHSKSDGTNAAVRKRHRLLTTLLDPLAFPALELCLLYHQRWEVELVFDECKNHLRLCQHPLRSRLPLLALQELYAILLAHWAVRSLMLSAAHKQQGVEPDRLSFTLAVQEVSNALLLSSCTHPQQVSSVLAGITACLLLPASLLPLRRLRFNSRVVKHTRSRFRRKLPHHRNVVFHDLSFSELLRI